MLSERRKRRRSTIRTFLAVILTWTGLLTFYFLCPVGAGWDSHIYVRLAVGIVLVALVVVWQVRRVLQAEYPLLRGIEALGAVIVLFLVLFSISYLALSYSSPTMFSQTLDHTKALYFTVTVFSTVGFGDITPTTDPSRIVVSTQMILDLIVIGAVVRLLIYAARTGMTRRGQRPSGLSRSGSVVSAPGTGEGEGRQQ